MDLVRLYAFHNALEGGHPANSQVTVLQADPQAALHAGCQQLLCFGPLALAQGHLLKLSAELELVSKLQKISHGVSTYDSSTSSLSAQHILAAYAVEKHS
jgi:hypothetical protein